MACDPNSTITTEKLQNLNTNANVFNEVITSTESKTPTKASDGQNKTTLAGLEEIALGKSRTSAPVPFVDGQFNYTVSGFNASLSSYYIYSSTGTFPTQLLIPTVDYTFANETTEEITLTSSWSGGEIIAKSLDPTGTGVVQSPVSFTESELIIAIGLGDGDEVVVTELGNARYVIKPSGFLPMTGDIAMNSGQVAHLQLDSQGMLNVDWFGANGDEDTSVDQLSYFNLAIDRAKQEETDNNRMPIIVASGKNYRVSADTKQAAMWLVMPRTNILGGGAALPTYENNTKHLLGKIISYNGTDQSRLVRYGDPAFTVQEYTGKGYTAIINGDGILTGGLAGTAHTSGKDDQGQACIGVTGVSLVDSDTGKGAWSFYAEAHRAPSLPNAGNSFCMEATSFNRGNTVQDTPYADVSYGQGLTYNQWLTTGGSPTDFPDCNDTTAAIGILGKGGAAYSRGIIFKKDSVSTGEAICLPGQYETVWFDKNTLDEEKRAAGISGVMPIDQGQLSMHVWDNAGLKRTVILTPSEFSPPNSLMADGAPGRRWITTYLVNSPDVSSDETLKKQRGSLNQNEINAGLAIARLPRMFQWIDEINSKAKLTGQTTYLHCSPMAQEVWSTLESNNLNPADYGFINDGDDYGAKWSLQPQELLWMICAAQQSVLDNFESRLSALEAK